MSQKESGSRLQRSTAAASTSSSPPRERDRADWAARGVPLRRRSGCTTVWSRSMRRRCRSRSATSSSCRRRSIATAADGGRLPHPRALPSAARLLRRAAQRGCCAVERIRNSRDAPSGEPDEFLDSKRQVFLDALADDFNTPQAFAVLFEIVAEGNRRKLSGAREVLTELDSPARAGLRCSGRRRWPRRGQGPPGRATGAPGKGLRPSRCPARSARGDGLGGPRRGERAAGPPTLVPDLERIYGRRAVAEAERPPRGPSRLAGAGDHRGGARASLRVARPPGGGGGGGPYPYADPSGLLDAEDALVVVLDQVQDPHNLGAVCRAAESPAPPGSSSPSAAPGGDGGGVQGVRRGGGAPLGGQGEERRRLAWRG